MRTIRFRWRLVSGTVGLMLIGAATAGAQFGGGMGGGGMGGGGFGGRGGMGGGRGFSGSGDDKELAAQLRAFDPDNPISLMMACRKDLKLRDSQVVALHALGDSLRAKDAPLWARVDTLRLAGGGDTTSLSTTALSETQRDSIMGIRKALADTRAQIHDNASVTRSAALALFTEKQQAKYDEIEERVLDIKAIDMHRGGWGGGGGGFRGGGFGGGGTGGLSAGVPSAS